MEEQYTLEEFGQFIKDSYPEYANVDNVVLAEKMLVKYPEYANRIVGSEPLKKKEDTLPLESPSATDSTAPTSPSVPKKPDAPGDSVSTVADPSKLTPAQQADIQTAAMELEPQVETETTYMAPVTADPVTSPTAEQALTAAMATRAESIEMGVDEQTVFEGTVSEYLLDMDGLEKERMSRIAGGESFFLDEEAGNFSLEFDEQYKAQAEDSRKSLVLIEDDIVKVATTPLLSALPPEDRINQVRDLKEQYLQSVPADFRARVEAMDLDEFVDYSLQNAQKRNFAEAYVGMSNLQDYDLEVMSGKMQGAMAAQMKKEDVDGSWVGERFAAPWSDFIGGFDGLMFGKSKSGVEAYDKDLEDINYILASYEDKPTDEQLIEIGKMRYRPEGQLGSLDYELNQKLGKPSSLYTNDAFFKQKGQEAVKLGKSYFEDLREKVQVGRNSHNDVAKLYAQSFNYDGSFRDVTSSLIDEKVLTEEQMQKTPWQNFAQGDVKAFGYQSLGHVFDLMPDMVKAFGATYIGGPQAMAAMFGTGAASQTTGEYASRPDVSGVEAIEVGFRAGAIEAGVTSFFAGLQVAQVGLARAVQEGAKQGVKKSSLQAGKQVVGDFLETTKGKTIKNWFGEGSEEGFIATFDQINRITSEVASGRMNTQEAVDEYFNPAAIGDAFYAGFLGGGVGSSPFVLAKGFSAIGSKFSLFDRLELKDRQDFLFEQLSRTDITAEERKGLRAELTKLHEDANRLARKDVEFYEQMEEEDLKELTRLNQEISNKRRKARQLAREEGTTSETRLQSLSNDVRGLMQQKLEIENKYDSAMEGYDLDVEAQTRNDAEVERLVDDILNVDREWDGLSDEVGEDASKSSGKIRLTGKNADSLLGRLLAGEIKGTKYATAEQIVDGIKNAFKMAKAVIADNPDAEVILVNSKEAYLREVEKADGKRPQKVSRGVHVSRDGGTMVLYAPALKTNTGYHEGFHQMVYRMMKGDGVDRGEAMLRLASALRRGMTKRQLQRYGNFLNQYGQLTDAGRAEEFLAELWSDITDGEVDIQFHKGIVSGWLRFVNQGLARKGLKVSGAPVLQDVVTGLKDAAEFFALGEGGAQESLSLAFDAAGKLRPGLNREGLLNRLELRRYRRNQRMSQATLVSAEDDRLKSQALVTAETSDFKVVRPGRDNKSNATRLASVMSEAIKQHNRLKTGVSIQVTPLNAAQIEAMMDDGTVFLEGTNAMEGGAIGYVEKNGYFGGLVKNPTYDVGGVQKALTLAAVENGATHLECYATFLEGNNINMGFAPVARIAFNEEFAPEGWDSEQSSIKDKPDIVFMAFDPVSAADSKPGDGIKLDDYGAALAKTSSQAEGNPVFDPTVREQATVFNEDDAKGIKENDGQVIGSFYELLAKRSEERDGAVYRYRGFFAGMAQGRMIFVDNEIPKKADGTVDRHIEFVFRPVNEEKSLIKLDEWFVSKAMDDEGNLIKGAENRGSGVGTRFMTMAMEVADELGIDVELMAFPTRNYQGTERQNMAASKKLVKYYQKFGFVTSFKDSESMVRVSQQNLDQLNAEETQETQDLGDATKEQAIEATVQFNTSTGRKWTVRRKFTDERHLSNFINYIEKKKGYRFDERWNHDTPPAVDPPEVIGNPKAQELAIDRINQELPSKTTQTLQVARLLNSFSGEIVQDEGELIKTFLDNVYEEAGFYLQQRDARTSGLTWYTEDIQEMKDKLAIIFPALESPDMSTIASAVLALTSSGTSPIQNMLTTVAILRNTPIDQQRSGNFSRNWGGDKMSFVGKNGKSIASGRIVKEGKTYFVVQNVNPLGKDTKGLVKIKKSELKKGYPKPTGYTARGKIVEAQLNKIQALFEKFKTPKAVVEFLTTDQPIQVLREYNKSVPDTKGKVNKNPAPGRRKGAYILGEKIGSFFLNIEGVGETLTADLWFNRTWNRYMGTMISTVKGVDVIQEVPRSEAERGIMTSAVTEAANELGLTVAELQATMWYFEQELWRRMGANSRSENFVMAIDNVASRLDLSNDTRKRLEEAGVNLDRAEEKRETAVSRADDKVSEESTTKEQALEDYLDQQEQDVSELKEQAQRVRIERQEDMGRFRGAMLDIMEFFYDKFYKAIRYQKEIEKGLNARVMREQDYDMALALLDGKASRRLQSVDSFMEDVAAVMNKHGITYDELGDFLYAMHAENRNEVLLERFEKKQQKLVEEIARLSEVSNSKDTTEGERRAATKKLKDLREELSDVESRIQKKNFSGKTNEEARADIERLDSEGMREAYDLVMDFQKETRNLIVEYGLETQTTVDKLEALYPSYVPLSGFAIDEDAGSEALEAGYLHMHQARVFRGIRRAEGRSSKAQNPLDYIFERRYQTVMAGEKNSANTKLLNLLVDNPEPSLYKVYGPKDKLPTQKGRRKGMSKGEARNNESFVEVVVNGESFFIEFSNSSVARAVNKHNITKLDAHPYVQTVFNFIRSFGRYLSATFTSYSPDFVGSNFVRDLQFGMSSLLAEQEIPGGQAYGERIALNSAKKITGSMRFLYGNFMGKTQDKSDPMYKYWQEFQDYGAITDWPYAKNTDVLRNDMETLTRMQDPSLSKRAAVGAVDGLRAVARYVNNVNMTVENATRFAVFQAARDAGVDAEQAAFLAKELTINFNRSGSGGSVINAIYLFFNAGVQGTSKFIRTIGTLRKVPDGRGGYYRQLNSAQKVAMGMSFFSVAQAALNQAISEEDEDGRTFYEKIPDYVKERNMVFMLPNATGIVEGQDYIKIPLPYGYNIFHNVGTMSYEASVGMRTPGDAAMFMVGGMANSFIPISFGQSSDAARGFAKAFSPTFFRPMTEIIVNESYYGTPVYNNNFPGQNLPASSLASRSPEWMKDAASFLNEATGGNEFEAGYLDGNPDKLWHVFEYYGGGAYRFGKNTFNTLEEPIKHIQGLTASEARESAGKALSTAPVARIFYGTTNDRQDVADYYEFRGTVRSAAQAQKELGLQEERYINSVQLNEIGKATDRQLRRIRRDIKASEKIEDPIKKARDINQLYDERMQVIKSFNREYLQYYEGRKKD